MQVFFKKIWKRFKLLCALFFAISIFSVILFRWVPIPLTPLMLIRCTEQMFSSGHKIKLNQNWVSIDKISPNLQLAVVCSEDQNFFQHSGFDFNAIEKAVEHNKNHKRKRGASTISQQTAKNVFLYDGRNWIRKGFEVYFTFLIEFFWSKERIMEVYLNVIEFGDGIYGVESASQEFFHTSAQKLTRERAALLASVLPNPRKFSPITPTSYVRKRQKWIIGQMFNWGGEAKYREESKSKE